MDFNHKVLSVSPYLLMLPAWYITGTLVLTWPVYFVAYVFQNAEEPLFYANIIIMPIALFISVLVFYYKFIKTDYSRPKLKNLLSSSKRSIYTELFLLAAILLLACILMWTTFFVRGDKLYVGISVFSDFSPHIGMIRSFSYGNNFPTAYSHYAGEDIRYHFMFQFLTGNLEYLGLRLDYAFNIPSILTFLFAFQLLYLLTVKITGKLGAGVLACLFFAFRSAKTLFTYLAGIPKGTGLWKALTENTAFISDTPHEDWGLWNLNVYCNQRHLAFGLAVIFFVLILFLPRLYEMFEELNTKNYSQKNKKMIRIMSVMKTVFFTKEGWLVKDYKCAIFSGIVLGGMGFFHGAAVICCLLILFMLAIVSHRRLEYAITAGITLLLTNLQTHFFIHGSAVSTKFLFGFIAENKTLFGAASYLDKLLGILPLVLLAAFCLEKGAGRYIILAFTTPLVFAFTISLTVDVTVNHKYIMMSCILLGIFAASFVVKLFEHKDLMIKLTGILLTILLTATGIYDFLTILKKNTPQSAVVLELKDPLTQWIKEHSNSKDIFLTSSYALNQAVLGGAMLYEGWPYFPWSAGYDTDFRLDQVMLMYEADTPKELEALVEKNHIRFIIIDQDSNEAYKVNKNNINTTYECVFSMGEEENNTSIYDTKKPLMK